MVQLWIVSAEKWAPAPPGVGGDLADQLPLRSLEAFSGEVSSRTPLRVVLKRKRKNL
jgi:hypothetical protein